MKLLVETLLDLVYPPPANCIVCGEMLEEDERDVCRRCFKAIEYIKEPVCRKCGKPLHHTKFLQYCYDCVTMEHCFTQGASVGVFDGILKQLIFHFKFKGKKRLAGLLSGLLIEKLETLNWPAFGCVVPVPLSRKRLSQRGFNQALLLAGPVAKALNCKLVGGNLIKVKGTRLQRELSRGERLKNLKGSFRVKNPKQFKAKRILLVDDIFTTGATVDECSRVLLESGVWEVFVLTLASGKGF